MRDFNFLQLVDVRQLPRLSAVGNVAVRQHHHGSHEASGDAPSFNRHIEAVGWAASRNHGHRAFAVATVERH